VVYVGDLDLTTGYGQQIMKHRVRATARDVCRELGEGPNNGSPIVPSCDDEAYRSARTQMRVAVNRAFESRAYAYATESYPYATDASDRVPY
jgi:UrcA family protein